MSLRSSTTLVLALALSNSAYSIPTVSSQLHKRADYPGYTYPSNGNCRDYSIKSTQTTKDLIWSYPRLENDFDTAALLFNITSKDDALGSFQPFNDTKEHSAEYEISGTFCSPKALKGNGTEKTVLVATHGFGFDRRYWAPEDEDYSFAKYALDAGYSFFYYDRLGVGKSQRISGFEEQASMQNALLANVLEGMHNGSYTGSVKANKLVLIGHSFGSFYSQALIAERPDLVDAAVLTGMAYGTNSDPAKIIQLTSLSTFASRIANMRDSDSAPQFANTFDNGWLSFGDIYAYAESFLHQPDYDVEVAKSSFAITQPFSIADFASTFSANLDVSKFHGKVLLTSGEFDLVLCGGNCTSTFAGGVQEQVWSGLKEPISTYVLPGAGHGANFAKNAGLMFAEIVRFLNAL
ncbi:alpha/beta-hydrolase [Lophiostoma macrostomum CBS 122681]|uniref:Alpha/beta-hydrolase n=1 Tax=Lophiostoma macrostomum CBS 122681 TaxID=1314788 RepID=A0A6A6T0I9_9PLEO|nr:alpha/beta-hydrolase [Lophiostoma macrostomum CBS 122681]